MNIFRSEKNPIITPEDIKPSRPDFKVVCVFNCGNLYEEGKVKIYYGAADTCIAYAEVKLKDILYQLK